MALWEAKVQSRLLFPQKEGTGSNVVSAWREKLPKASQLILKNDSWCKMILQHILTSHVKLQPRASFTICNIHLKVFCFSHSFFVFIDRFSRVIEINAHR